VVTRLGASRWCTMAFLESGPGRIRGSVTHRGMVAPTGVTAVGEAGIL